MTSYYFPERKHRKINVRKDALPRSRYRSEIRELQGKHEAAKF